MSKIEKIGLYCMLLGFQIQFHSEGYSSTAGAITGIIGWLMFYSGDSFMEAWEQMQERQERQPPQGDAE